MFSNLLSPHPAHADKVRTLLLGQLGFEHLSVIKAEIELELFSILLCRLLLCEDKWPAIIFFIETFWSSKFLKSSFKKLDTPALFSALHIWNINYMKKKRGKKAKVAYNLFYLVPSSFRTPSLLILFLPLLVVYA